MRRYVSTYEFGRKWCCQFSICRSVSPGDEDQYPPSGMNGWMFGRSNKHQQPRWGGFLALERQCFIRSPGMLEWPGWHTGLWWTNCVGRHSTTSLRGPWHRQMPSSPRRGMGNCQGRPDYQDGRFAEAGSMDRVEGCTEAAWLSCMDIWQTESLADQVHGPSHLWCPTQPRKCPLGQDWFSSISFVSSWRLTGTHPQQLPQNPGGWLLPATVGSTSMCWRRLQRPPPNSWPTSRMFEWFWKTRNTRRRQETWLMMYSCASLGIFLQQLWGKSIQNQWQ